MVVVVLLAAGCIGPATTDDVAIPEPTWTIAPEQPIAAVSHLADGGLRLRVVPEEPTVCDFSLGAHVAWDRERRPAAIILVDGASWQAGPLGPGTRYVDDVRLEAAGHTVDARTVVQSISPFTNKQSYETATAYQEVAVSSELELMLVGVDLVDDGPRYALGGTMGIHATCAGAIQAFVSEDAEAIKVNDAEVASNTGVSFLSDHVKQGSLSFFHSEATEFWLLQYQGAGSITLDGALTGSVETGIRDAASAEDAPPGESTLSWTMVTPFGGWYFVAFSWEPERPTETTETAAPFA